MKTRLLMIGLASLLLLANMAFAQEIEDKGDFVLNVQEPQSDDSKAVRDFLTERGRFTDLITNLNDILALPENLKITFRDGEPGDAYYMPSDKEIVISYQFVDTIYGIFLENKYVEPRTDEAFSVVLDVVEGVLYHEIGHALIDSLEIPIVGREEDAVDGLSAIIIAKLLREPENLISQIKFWEFLGEGQRSELKDEDFQDEHGLHKQRQYNILCWVFGSNPEGFAELAQQEGLGEDRASGCPAEWKQLKTSWITLLAPYIKGQSE